MRNLTGYQVCWLQHMYSINHLYIIIVIFSYCKELHKYGLSLVRKCLKLNIVTKLLQLLIHPTWLKGLQLGDDSLQLKVMC